MSDASSDSSSRLDALEMLVTHQDRTIADLNDVIASQWRRIEALERQVAQLRHEFQSMGTPRDVPEPPPPHY